jgi:hypothetical protein
MTLHRSTHLLSLLPLALGLGACVDGNADSGLTVLHVAAPQTGCMYATNTGIMIPAGIIESDAAGGYLMGVEVRNDLELAEGEAPTPKTVFITGARVEIEFYDDKLYSAAEQDALRTEGVTRFVAPFAGSIAPNGGLAVLPFESVPLELIRAIGDRLPDPSEEDPDPRAVLDVQVRVLGTRGGGGVESNLFRYPVQVCNGCLTDYLGRCSQLSPTEPVDLGGVCQLVQDGQVDCCLEDHDDLEVPCEEGGPPPPTGKVCDDGIDQIEFMRCPARALEL